MVISIVDGVMNVLGYPMDVFREALFKLSDFIVHAYHTRSLFIVCMGIGFVVPLLSVLFGGISSLFDLDFDIDFDTNPVTMFFPTSPMCLFAALLVFGGTGLLLAEYTNLSEGGVLSLAILCGYIVSVLLNRILVVPLKNSKADACSEDNLVNTTGEVISDIRSGELGQISIKTNTGNITFLAKSNSLLEVGTEIVIVDICHNDNTTVVIVDKLDGLNIASKL